MINQTRDNSDRRSNAQTSSHITQIPSIRTEVTVEEDEELVGPARGQPVDDVTVYGWEAEAELVSCCQVLVQPDHNKEGPRREGGEE